jgi:hypothetical protein
LRSRKTTSSEGASSRMAPLASVILCLTLALLRSFSPTRISTIASTSSTMMSPYAINFGVSRARRELDILQTASVASTVPAPPASVLTSVSHRLPSGIHAPPGLRFPSGAIIGRYFVLHGVQVTELNTSFAVWALDLGLDGASGLRGSRDYLRWMRIDQGIEGSWSRAVYAGSSLVAFGTPSGNLRADYSRRQVSSLVSPLPASC